MLKIYLLKRCLVSAIFLHRSCFYDFSIESISSYKSSTPKKSNIVPKSSLLSWSASGFMKSLSFKFIIFYIKKYNHVNSFLIFIVSNKRYF